MSKKILTFATLLFLITSLGIFVIGSQAEAISQCPINECPPNKKSGTESEYIKMQIPIPGVTNSCTYDLTYQGKAVSKDGKKVTKTCHYVSANLPLYIKNIYKISIGIIAIIAVVTIMVAGLQWIFAAGNPTTIGNAKSQITAAVSGLILVLCSYVILYTINPSLVELRMQPIKEIGKVEQGTRWCKDLPEGSKIRRKLIGQGAPEEFKDKDKISDICGAEYEIEGSRKNKDEEFKACWGIKCSGEKKFCYQYLVGERPFCAEAEGMCNLYDDEKGESEKSEDDHVRAGRESGCDEFDEILQYQNLSYVCGKRFDRTSIPNFLGFGSGDECALGKELACPSSHPIRISCVEESDNNECSFKEEKTKIRYPASCNFDSHNVFGYLTENLFNTEDRWCVDKPARGASGVNSICCKNSSNEYKCVY